ncbi:PKD domain-containing protein [Chryseolinea lacunae]|uniref:PKD domain-containing protein n=1 Tax=Chryseolinea lacunae TaxID=2801331 RepID=A0ABS1L0Q4_9BACT|nr:PKD domain-containing protein [Chryseolinea lacunae]MBL0745278.1 PKD domain-containing protein [Chryseolinea lacunae]
MKYILFILFVGITTFSLHSCSDDGFPVPPASTVPKFTSTVNNESFAPATATFKNESIIPERAGDVVYTWSFGDGTSSSEASPTHEYTEPGSYKVNLVVVTTKSQEINDYSVTLVIKDPNAVGIPVFFSDKKLIYSSIINDQAPVASQLNIPALQECYGMVVDTVNSKLYMADYGRLKILVSDLDGKNQQDFRTNIGAPTSLAIDYKDGLIYWDTGSAIRRAKLNDASVGQYEDVATGQADPEGVAIDPANRVVYWNCYDGGVWKKGMDQAGGEQQIITTEGGGSIFVVKDRIYFDAYFAASDDSSIKSAKLDGSDVSTIASGLGSVVYGIAYDRVDNKLYWVDRYEEKIMRATLTGENTETWLDAYATGLTFGKRK